MQSMANEYIGVEVEVRPRVFIKAWFWHVLGRDDKALEVIKKNIAMLTTERIRKDTEEY